jgi:hypothetical protein
MSAPRTIGALSLCVAALVIGLDGCASDDPSPSAPWVGETSEAIKAPLTKSYCSLQVKGKGLKQMEEDYLPHVIACENGDADPEALKAQAIAARSAVIWTVASYGSICDSQSCQVYTCSRKPEAKHFAAVKATSGMYMANQGQVTYGFFVNGSVPTDSSCHNTGASSLDHYITYNQGRSGKGVKLTSLGSPAPGQNRGCMSQFGARCLEKHGKNYLDILHFYYGEDIELLTAPGDCVDPKPAASACVNDTDCTNNTPGEAVICKGGACVDGCRKDADCSSGATCSAKDGKTAGTCSQKPTPLGTSCDSDGDCQKGTGAAGRVCGASSKTCIVGCHSNGDCGSGAICDKSTSKWRCVKRKELGDACASNNECSGGVGGTKRVCADGVCSDACSDDFDCADGETCDKAKGQCTFVPSPPEEPKPEQGCVLEYPSVKIKGIETPTEVRKQYGQRNCDGKMPACMIDVNNIVDADSGKKLSYNHVKLSPNFTLRELTHQSAAVSPFVYVSPALVTSLQATRGAYGSLPVTSGFRSAAKQAQVCKQMCGKETCFNAAGDTTCARCSNHMDGKAADLPHSSPKCDLASKTCDPGQMHLIFNEKAGGDHLHVDLGSSPVCTYKDMTPCGKGSSDPKDPPSKPSQGPNEPESPAASSGPCIDQLKALGVSFEKTTERNVVDAVRLTGPLNGITIADGTKQGSSNQAFSCALVRTLHTFMGALKDDGFTRIGTLGSYCLRCCCAYKQGTNECRSGSDPFPQCGSKGLSNHSYGRALDIRYLTKSDGTTYDLNDNGTWVRYGSFQSKVDTCGAGIKAQSGTSKMLYQIACDNASIFTTWLTANHNGDHRNHWHVDVGTPSDHPGGASVRSRQLNPEDGSGVLEIPAVIDNVDSTEEEDSCGGE